jgi:hypothetical protein
MVAVLLCFFTIYKILVNYLIKKVPILNVLHLESDKEKWKCNNSMMILHILVAFFEQVSAEKIYITVIAIYHFMFGMMQLSAKHK